MEWKPSCVAWKAFILYICMLSISTLLRYGNSNSNNFKIKIHEFINISNNLPDTIFMKLNNSNLNNKTKDKSDTPNSSNKSEDKLDNIEQLVTIPLLRKNPASIIYIKTWKTASSTITNLLHVYTVKHNKSCLLLSDKFKNVTADPMQLYVFDFKKYEDRKFASQSIQNKYTWNRNKSLDIWLHHINYDPFLFELIPSSNNQIVTILREPNQRLLSAFYQFPQIFKFHQYNYSLLHYINVTRNLDILADKTVGLFSMCNSLTLTSNSGNVSVNVSNVWKHIISGNFLLLIRERFDESLLLLKYAYNLSWSDLVFTPMKVSRNYANYILTEREDIALKKLLECDWKLYNMAQRIFDYRLYQIYKGNKTKMNNDINTMKGYQHKRQLLCNSINNYKFNYSHPMYIEHLICKSIQLDNVQWNFWAKNINQIK